MAAIEKVVRSLANSQLSIVPYFHCEDPQGEAGCPSYPLTRFELRLLARHWAHVVLNHDIFLFVYAQYSRGDFLDRYYALERLHAIAAVLGEGFVDEAFAQVKAVLRERWGERIWTAFEADDRDSLGPNFPWDEEPEGTGDNPGPAASQPQ